MKVVKLSVLALLITCFAAPASAGIVGGLGLALHDVDDFGIQARTGVDIAKSEFTFGVDWYFEGNNWWAFNLDYHFVIQNEGRTSRFYPLAGVQIATDFDGAEEFGVNVGGGMNFNMTDTMAAYAEAKFVIGDIDGLNLCCGIKF